MAWSPHRFVQMLTSSFTRQASLLKTALRDFHVSHGAEMTEYAGYDMPVKFEGIIPEHKACRKESALFDTGHMGQYLITGEDRIDFAKRVAPVFIPENPDNKARLSILTNENGGIIDDCTFCPREDGVIFLVVNAGTRKKDDKHLREQLEIFKSQGKKAELTWLEGRSLLALQGPKSAEVMERISGTSVSKIPFMVTHRFTIDGTDVWATRCGYTGEDGFEIGIDKESDAVKVADILASQPEVHLAGLGSRDALRLESGLCLYGHEMNEHTTPIEASLAWLVNKTRRSDGFIGAEKILPEIGNRKLAKPHRRVGVVMTCKAPPPREHCAIFDMKDKKIGEVTSGSYSVMLEKGIAMAYLPVSYANPAKANPVRIEIRDRRYSAKVTELPFVPSHFYRGA